MFRSALRGFLFAVANLCALIAAVTIVCMVDSNSSALQGLWAAPFVVSTSIAVGIGALCLRCFVRPGLHRDRAAARAEWWNDWLFVGSYGLLALVVGGGMLILNWPPWLAAFSGALIVCAQVWSIFKRDARRKVRKWDGLCPTCGYDLRGLPQLRCPECGLEAAVENADETRSK